ncbi:MAG: glycosyltransferase [Candidatus Hodarchaeota archaeon]
MKILRIITRLNIGGPSIQVLNLHDKFSSFLLFGKVSKGEMEINLFKNLEFNWYQLNYLKREISPINDFISFWQIRNWIKCIKPDIVHTHTSKAGALGRFAAITLKTKPKIIHTFHGNIFEGYFCSPKAWIFKLIEKYLAKKSDALIAISESQKLELTEKYKIINQNKIHLIPLGFDLDVFDSVYRERKKNYKKIPLDKQKDHIYNIGIVGRIAHIKNHDLFLDILSGLKNYPQFNGKIRGWIIGNGEQKIVNKLEEKIKDLNLDCIVFGYMDHNSVSNFYKIADMILCTSNNEGTPVSLIEAMASGVPVASMMNGGCKDLICPNRKYLGITLTGDAIKDGRNIGQFFVYGRVPDKNKKFDRVFTEDRIADAHDYVMEKYSLNRLIKEIKDLYEKLLS